MIVTPAHGRSGQNREAASGYSADVKDSKKEKRYGIPHSLGEHRGVECAAPEEAHWRCEMCGACYTCAGSAEQAARKSSGESATAATIKNE